MKKNFFVLSMALFAWMFLATASHASPTPPNSLSCDFAGDQIPNGADDGWAGEGGLFGNFHHGGGMLHAGGEFHALGWKKDHGNRNDDGHNGWHGWHGCNSHPAPAVPIPGIVWLLGTGLTGLMALRRHS